MINGIYCVLAVVTSAQAYYVPQEAQHSLICKPNHLYASENITCVCSQEGIWPHKDCKAAFGHHSGSNDNKQCEPGGYAVVECNVCRCSLTGEIDHSQCTKNVCEEEAKNIVENKKYRRSDGVLGNCVESTWYSMAPCQYCYCANKNKLLCNTGGISKSELQLGSYKLSVCETDLQQDINALYPKPLRDGGVPNGGVPNSKSTKALEEAVETKTDDTIDEDFGGIDAKSIDVEKYKEDEKDEETTIDNTEITVNKHVTKAKVIKTVTKKVLRKETLGVTAQPATATPKVDESSDDENSASNDKVDVGLNLDLGQPEPENDQIEDDLPEKAELDDAATSIEDKENTEATKDVAIFSQPNTLSDMLDKFIHLAIRKSMMTLKPGDSCVPGSQTHRECNLCFCLKNGKLLCTNKTC